TTAEPCIAQRGVESDRCVERIPGLLEVVFRAQHKSAQRVRGGAARRELETCLECRLCLRHSTKVELRLSDPRPGKTRACIEVGRAIGGLQCPGEIGLRLPVI